MKPGHIRILVAQFNGNPPTSIIVHYAPTERDEDVIDH